MRRPASSRSSPRRKAPFGSLYHHFPGGKVDLAAEAIRTAGAAYVGPGPAVFDAGAGPGQPGSGRSSPRPRRTWGETGYADACPIATVALEVASTNETLRQATAEVFDGWLDYGTRLLLRPRTAADLARDLTLALVTALEGAFVLDQATRRTDALAWPGSGARLAGRAVA